MPVLVHSIFFDLFPHLLTSHVFFFNDTATTEIYTLSLHDALPISSMFAACGIKVTLFDKRNDLLRFVDQEIVQALIYHMRTNGDRKSTRLNSSHSQISYAVFCLKKKKI